MSKQNKRKTKQKKQVGRKVENWQTIETCCQTVKQVCQKVEQVGQKTNNTKLGIESHGRRRRVVSWNF